MDSLFIGVVGAATIVYFPMLSRAVLDKHFDRVSQLSTGIMLTWLSLVGTKLLNTYMRANDAAASHTEVLIVAALGYMAVLGGVLHISAPGMVGSEWKYNKKSLYAGLVVGAVLSIASVLIGGRA